MNCCGTAYVIQSDETLRDIAARFLGSSGEWRRIVTFNNDDAMLALGGARISNPNAIQAGATIRIPTTDVPRAPVQPVSTLSPQPVAFMVSPRSDVFAYLAVHWNTLRILPLEMIVGVVMQQVPSAERVGEDQTESYILQWLISVDKQISDGTFHIDIPDLTVPKSLVFGKVKVKWAPIKSTGAPIKPPSTKPQKGKLSISPGLGTFTIEHLGVQKIESYGLTMPISKDIILNGKAKPGTSYGLGGAIKTPKGWPTIDLGATLEEKKVTKDLSLKYKFGLKGIDLSDDVKLDVSTSGPFKSFDTQSFTLKLRWILDK